MLTDGRSEGLEIVEWINYNLQKRKLQFVEKRKLQIVENENYNCRTRKLQFA